MAKLNDDELSVINHLILESYINAKKHPSKELTVLKYSKPWEIAARKADGGNAGYLAAWTPVQMMARGLVIANDGTIVSRPFKKFFNIEDYDYRFPDGPFTIFEKLDGSAIVVSRYKGELIVNTLGSFESEQAAYARNMLESTYQDLVKNFKDGKTYIFEIIYPENQIVIKYQGEPRMVLLGIVDNETGDDDSLDSLDWPYKPTVYHYDSIDKLITSLGRANFNNEEGYVVYFHQAKKRIKFKFQRYVEIHRIRSNLTPTAIWELLRDGDSIAMIHDLPDEFINEINLIVDDLTAKYEKIEHEAKHHFSLGRELLSHSRKDFALWAQAHERSHLTYLLFSMADGKSYSKQIWNMIKPKAEDVVED